MCVAPPLTNLAGSITDLSSLRLGQEEFDRLRSLSYAETHVVMLCFSVSTVLYRVVTMPLRPLARAQVDNPTSLVNIETKVRTFRSTVVQHTLIPLQWIDEVLEYCPGVKVCTVLSFVCLVHLMSCFSSSSSVRPSLQPLCANGSI